MEGARVDFLLPFLFRFPILNLYLIRVDGAVGGYDDVAVFCLEILYLLLILFFRLADHPRAPEIVPVGVWCVAAYLSENYS